MISCLNLELISTVTQASDKFNRTRAQPFHCQGTNNTWACSYDKKTSAVKRITLQSETLREKNFPQIKKINKRQTMIKLPTITPKSRVSKNINHGILALHINSRGSKFIITWFGEFFGEIVQVQGILVPLRA